MPGARLSLQHGARVGEEFRRLIPTALTIDPSAPHPRHAGEGRYPRRVPGMAMILEVQVFYGPDGRNR